MQLRELSWGGLGLLPWELLRNLSRARNRASNGHRHLEGSRFVASQLCHCAASGSRKPPTMCFVSLRPIMFPGASRTQA